MDLGEGIRQALAKLTRSVIIDAKTIKEFNKELQKTLISADVDVRLVLQFTSKIEEKALKSKPPAGLSQTDYITNIVYDELVALMGASYAPKLERQRILLLGLYGSGKTTTAAKLAKFYKDKGLGAAVICCDVRRPAAYEQLETLAKQADVAFFGMKDEKDPVRIVKEGMERFKDKDVVICDTSGRSALDADLARELTEVAGAFQPKEKLLVVSADIGQVSGRQAAEFDKAVKITGVVVTKMDGSAKGGGALSAANAAKAQVEFIGVGEKLNSLEPYNSEKFIGGLLGMPDIGALVNKVQDAIKEANISPEDLESGELDFDMFYKQLKAMGGMGPLKGIMSNMGMPDMPADVMEKGEGRLKKYKVIIGSMTRSERKDEKMLHEPGRITRIAKGSGTSEADVRSMISEFNRIRKMFNSLKNDRGFKRRFSKFF